VLEREDPSSIALNIDPQIAFSSGLHAGELNLTISHLGLKWAKRMKGIPMLAVEFVATMPKAQLGWYRKLMETSWAMISEGFSPSVIAPGVTTTTVCLFYSPFPKLKGDSFADDKLVTGCRMVAPLANPSLELYDLVPPLRLNYHSQLRSGAAYQWRGHKLWRYATC
jgi:hypothetical protein